MNMKYKSKKAIAVLLAALLTAVSIPAWVQAETLPAKSAKDIKGHWAEVQIQQGMEKGFINGFPDGTFKPDAPVTRAQFAKMINSALGLNVAGNIKFTDVPANEWYYNEIAKGIAAAYITGYDDNKFKPEDYITRQEAAVIISRIVPNTAQAVSDLSGFGDRHSVSDWAKVSMGKAVSKGYIGAYNDGLLHPVDNLTRAQTAKILMDIVTKEKIVKDKYDITSPGTSIADGIYTGIVTVQKEVGDGDVSIKNCVILGSLIVNGGGMNSVKIENSRIAKTVVERKLAPVRVEISGDSTVVDMAVAANASIECVKLTTGVFGEGVRKLSVGGSASTTVKGKIKEISVDGYSANLYLTSAEVQKLTLTQQARATNVTLDGASNIREANVNTESNFYGDGTIHKMIVGANKVRYSKQPLNVQVLAGVTDKPVLTGQQSELGFNASPRSAETNVRQDVKIVLKYPFSVKYKDGYALSLSDVTASYDIREGSRTGSLIDFTPALYSSGREIHLAPKSILKPNTTYYVVQRANMLKDESGNMLQEKSYYFRTGNYSQLPSDKPALFVDTSRVGSSITLKAKANMSGTVYAVVLDRDKLSPSESQIKEGKDAQGFTLPYNQRKSSAISANSTISLSAFTGLDEKKEYIVYSVLYANGKYSTIYSSRVQGTVPTSMLNALSVDAFKDGNSNGQRLNLEPEFSSTAAVTEYRVTLPFGTNKVLIKAGSAGVSAIKFAEGSSAFAAYTKDQLELPIAAGDEKTIRIQVLEDGKRATVYTLKISAKGNTGNVYKFAQTFAVQAGSVPIYTFDAGTGTIDVQITLVDKSAKITSSQIFFDSGTHADGIWKGKIKGLSDGDTREISYTVTSHGVSDTVKFKIEIAKQ